MNELALAFPPSVQATRTALVFSNGISYEEWERVGDMLSVAEGAIHWWIGDWLNYGEQKFWQATQALDEFKFSYSTLAIDKWVANKFADLLRRRKNLSWSHHREAADLPEDEQDELLDKAIKEDIKRAGFRKLVRQHKRNKQIAANVDRAKKETDKYRVILGDFVEESNALASNGIDAIITDPPYPEEHLPLYADLAQIAARVLKPGGSLIVMVGQSYLPKILELMTPHLEYQWIVAYLTPGGQAPQIWQRKVNTFWKPILWFVKGIYDGDWVGDVCKSDTNDNDKRFHDWGQSESGMIDIVERFTLPGDLILDPFCGGGTTGVVAVGLNRRFIGIDKDEQALNITAARLAEYVI